MRSVPLRATPLTPAQEFRNWNKSVRKTLEFLKRKKSPPIFNSKFTARQKL